MLSKEEKRRGSTPKRDEEAKKTKEGSPTNVSVSTKETLKRMGLDDEEEDSDEIESE